MCKTEKKVIRASSTLPVGYESHAMQEDGRSSGQCAKRYAPKTKLEAY